MGQISSEKISFHSGVYLCSLFQCFLPVGGRVVLASWLNCKQLLPISSFQRIVHRSNPRPHGTSGPSLESQKKHMNSTDTLPWIILNCVYHGLFLFIFKDYLRIFLDNYNLSLEGLGFFKGIININYPLKTKGACFRFRTGFKAAASAESDNSETQIRHQVQAVPICFIFPF